LAACCAVAALLFAPVLTRDLILFNHSPSVPTGFYVRTERPLTVGMLATVRALDVAPDMARERGYDGEGDRFIKRVAALGGQAVCGDGESISIDGRAVAVVYRPEGRSPPQGWVGCRTLSDDEILLLGDSPDSFDGRYWGPINVRLIEGAWRPL
ncbi:MAG TPA: S26 family signal peptidase, partial [Candidatus Binatia bacterium]|nr:S26 family signal peptidase [Candidatus Binatia bacterium]